ncbi:MAG: hypothetical protein U9R15_17300 [Chloroflexota bacterium]|nr:hypothetical protein [Chloroflexota bacterium]
MLDKVEKDAKLDSIRSRGQQRGKIWTQRDRFGNDVYLTYERWRHIIAPDNHPQVAPYDDYLQETIRLGQRKQDPIIPNTYKYYRRFDDLLEGMSHMVAVVVFRWATDSDGVMHEEKFIVTAYFQFF